MLNINLKTIRLLTLLEFAPKYGKQLAQLAPEVFVADDHIQIGRKITKIPASNVYVILSRAVKAGLIEQIEDYKPPASLDLDESVKGRLKWYGITADGRRALREARETLKLK